ncbi:MAG: TonB-dependent receptor [Acidobacteriia bacterium]|nr:TonB-dependent receptor [Terriglobia bacterium]
MLKAIRHGTLRYFLGFVCFVLMGTGTLLGQGTAGTITGTVTDPTGAVIPEATVTVANQGTGVNFHLTTNSSGVYSITSLIPGTYTVTVSQKGFKTYVNQNLGLSVNELLRIDAQLEIGVETQTVTVEAVAPLVNTTEGRLSSLVSATQIQSMPLNGRNIYQLMQLIPGAVNSTGVNLENAGTGGIATNINGTRLNFNGFLMDGVANKGLTGGANAQPSPDFVQEFRIMTNDFSAQYGNSAGSVTDVSIKTGTNSLHGAVWEYLRNDKLNARNFFDGDIKSKWRQNQFGADVGGPIKKEKLFFFAGYEGERFRTESPAEYTIETPAWRQAVRTALPNSVATLLYTDFPGPDVQSGMESYTVEDVVNQTAIDDLGANVGGQYDNYTPGTLISNSFMAYTDPCFLNYWNYIGAPAFSGGPTWGDAQVAANTFASLVGVTAAESAQIQTNINAVCPGMGLAAPAVQSGAMARDAWMLGTVRAKFATRTVNQFYNGDQFTGRLDYQGDQNRIFGRFFFSMQKDPNVTSLNSAIRGFTVPMTASFPSAAFSWVRSFSPNVVNELRLGYTRNQLSDIPNPTQFGVPQISFDFGEVNFGAYNGYPQFFVENVYNYVDMLSIVKGKHSLKLGGEFKRNIENSEFNVGRPSYYFFDMLYFAANLPYQLAAGVNPELTTGGAAHIDTNIRGFRNYELGFFVQDDWKVTKNLTLNFGLRWDYFAPHTEKYGNITNFHYGPGADAVERHASINCQATISGECAGPAGDTNTPNGGFVAAQQLTPPDRNNFSPRFGFAWDPRGNGKTAIRGGFAIFYEAGIYNPLSNSRWNLPFYSFNIAMPIFGYPGLPLFGPTNPDGTPNTSATPSYSGAPDNPGQGPAGLGFAGNIMGWYPGNPNLAYLTGIPDPAGMRTPYVENAFLGVQQELTPSMVLEANWVMTLGKKLFWAENPNRVVNGYARASVIDPCTGVDAAPTPLVNPCFGTLRTWMNSVNSNYNALQVSVTRKMSRGLAMTSAYTWSHTLDFRSDWHALTSGGSANWANAFGASGYSYDPKKVFLEYGNSSFDIRQRWVTSLSWELPWLKDQRGVAGKILGGWQTNYNVSLQTGFPFTVGARRDYNGDGIRGDRPDTPSWGNSRSFTNTDFLQGSAPDGGSVMQSLLGDFPRPADGTDGNLGRNTFRGPGIANVDFSLFKKIAFKERYSMEFRAEFFNLFNRVNLYPPDANLASANFGLSQQAFDPRVIQFGLRFAF